jgi:predicted transcriptional regulator of viral defense system
MKELEILEKLKDKAIFSVQDIERIGRFNREYSKLVLNRLFKRGLIKRITKNTYTLKNDIYVVASNLKIPSYISFWSASYYYGYTEQILNTIYIACTRKINIVRYLEYKIKFIKIKDFFGYKKINTDNGEVFIVEIEKLLIDSLLYHKEMGNFDEIEKIFKNSNINKEKLLSYLKKINNKSLNKRVGYLLEKYKDIDISKNFKNDRNYVFLNQFSKKYKTLNSKWMVKI